MLYVEHDAPLTPDCPIPLDDLADRIIAGESNCIRFHFESPYPEEHEHLMIQPPQNNLLKTLQWSQRPHLASTKYYQYQGEHVFESAASGSADAAITFNERMKINSSGDVNITGIATATQLFEGTSRVATAGKAVAMALVFG